MDDFSRGKIYEHLLEVKDISTVKLVRLCMAITCLIVPDAEGGDEPSSKSTPCADASVSDGRQQAEYWRRQLTEIIQYGRRVLNTLYNDYLTSGSQQVYLLHNKVLNVVEIIGFMAFNILQVTDENMQTCATDTLNMCKGRIAGVVTSTTIQPFSFGPGVKALFLDLSSNPSDHDVNALDEEMLTGAPHLTDEVKCLGELVSLLQYGLLCDLSFFDVVESDVDADSMLAECNAWKLAILRYHFLHLFGSPLPYEDTPGKSTYLQRCIFNDVIVEYVERNLYKVSSDLYDVSKIIRLQKSGRRFLLVMISIMLGLSKDDWQLLRSSGVTNRCSKFANHFLRCFSVRCPRVGILGYLGAYILLSDLHEVRRLHDKLRMRGKCHLHLKLLLFVYDEMQHKFSC